MHGTISVPVGLAGSKGVVADVVAVDAILVAAIGTAMTLIVIILVSVAATTSTL